MESNESGGTLRAAFVVFAVAVAVVSASADPWSVPINLGSPVNTGGMDAGSALSFDGTELYFTSNRTGGFGSRDIYRTTRSKLGGSE